MSVLFSPIKLPVRRVLSQLRAQYSNMTSSTPNFNVKHLKKGDPQPPHNGIPRLYNMRFCPYAQRTLLALIAKKIPFEVVNVNLAANSKPEWLTSVSPLAKVPALEISEGVSIIESLISVEYLDEAYPQRPLFPKDPVKKAFDKIIVEGFTPITMFFIKLIKNPEGLTEENHVAFDKTLDYIQTQLKQRGDKFLSGNEPGFVDYMIWPWFERLLVVGKHDKRANIDSQKYKLLLKYLDAMLMDPVVAECRAPDEKHQKFLQAFSDGVTPNYDVMLEN